MKVRLSLYPILNQYYVQFGSYWTILIRNVDFYFRCYKIWLIHILSSLVKNKSRKWRFTSIYSSCTKTNTNLVYSHRIFNPCATGFNTLPLRIESSNCSRGDGLRFSGASFLSVAWMAGCLVGWIIYGARNRLQRKTRKTSSVS